MNKWFEWSKQNNLQNQSERWIHKNNSLIVEENKKQLKRSSSANKNQLEESKQTSSENQYEFKHEFELINDRVDFLEFCLRLSTEKEIWWKIGIDWEDLNFEDAQEYVGILKSAYEKLRWIPLKLNTLMYFSDNDCKQIIAEEAKHNVIMKMNETLQELLEYWDDSNSQQMYEGMGVELIEFIRKKIVY